MSLLVLLRSIVSGTSSPPGNLSAPVVSGTLAVGATLTTSDGTWSNSPTSFSYQWQRADDLAFTLTVTNIGTNVNNYSLTSGENGKYVRCVVTATNGGGSTPANSNVVGPIGSAPSFQVAIHGGRF